MKECCKKQSCEQGHEEVENKCCCCHKGGEKAEFAFLKLADCAWMEVLKEKIKAHIESSSGAQMTELAKIIAESNAQRWRNKMAKKQHCEDFADKLCGFFDKSKK